MTTTPTTRDLPATLRLGAVHITVTDLDRAVAWYQRSLGLRVHRHDVGDAVLGDGTADVVVLHQDPAARPPGRTAGLYHYALLYPTREELARAAVRLGRTRTPIQGASDHLTHEAIYLADPDGNGIELAADRPRDRWPAFEQVYAGGPQPLDTDDLLGSIAGEAPTDQVGPGLRVGHVHLHVGNVADGLAFYVDALGFTVEANLGSAAFVAAGGYHHHLAFNVWRGEGIPAQPPHAVGLVHWTVVLETAEEVAEVRARVEAAGIRPTEEPGGFRVLDPWGIAVVVTV
jgi:catechol 2,3-dioxygenase